MIKTALYGPNICSNKVQVATNGLKRFQLSLQRQSKDMHKSQGKLLKPKLDLLNFLKEVNDSQLHKEIKSLQHEVDSLLETKNTKMETEGKTSLAEGWGQKHKVFSQVC